MMYYKVSYSINPKEVGRNDGTPLADLDKSKFSNKDAFEKIQAHRLSPYRKNEDWRGKMLDFPPEFQGVVLNKKAILTDFVSFNSAWFHTSASFLINPKAFDFLQTLNLPPHVFYPVRLFHGEYEVNTYKLWFIPILLDKICYSKTVYTDNRLTSDKTEVVFPNEEQFVGQMGAAMIPKKLVLKDTLISGLDYFSLAGSNCEAFCSGSFVQKYEALKLTGLEMSALPKDFFNWDENC